MTSKLAALHTSQGATLAADGIALHYPDQAGEFKAAHGAAVLMDRSHEGRLQLSGRDRLAVPHRISTNAIDNLAVGAAIPTLFLTSTARIIDRAVIAADEGESALVFSEPGRAQALASFLKSNIFYNDVLQVNDITPVSRQFVLIGPQAAALMGALGISGPPLTLHTAPIADITCAVLHDKRLGAASPLDVWRIIVPSAPPTYPEAATVWAALHQAGAAFGLEPAGSLAYYALRVEAGRPGVNAELSAEYIPLEVGLWDEVSFAKGCYTGQEIIARMESRAKLARTIVHVRLEGSIPQPLTPCTIESKPAGAITSAVVTALGEAIGLAVVRQEHANTGAILNYEGGRAHIIARAGVQPSLAE